MNGYANPETYDVALVLDNVEEVYVAVGELLLELDYPTPEACADVIEVFIRDLYLEGVPETNKYGEAVIRDFLNQVRWYDLGVDWAGYVAEARDNV